jgi:hypothetical protein
MFGPERMNAVNKLKIAQPVHGFLAGVGGVFG